jgi:hypothetical protein
MAKSGSIALVNCPLQPYTHILTTTDHQSVTQLLYLPAENKFPAYFNLASPGLFLANCISQNNESASLLRH